MLHLVRRVNGFFDEMECVVFTEKFTYLHLRALTSSALFPLTFSSLFCPLSIL